MQLKRVKLPVNVVDALCLSTVGKYIFTD